MNKHADLVYDVWDSHSNYISKKSNPIAELKTNELISSFFCPASFYVYIIDFPSRRFDFVSHHVCNILGLQPEEYMLETLLERVHPHDIDFVSNCEKLVADFIVRLKRPQVTRYKINYCFRLKVKDGSYRLFLHQALALNTHASGALDKVLGIHSDIHHITKENNYKISFIGLNDEPSFLEMDVEAHFKKENSSASPFSRRELEVVRLLAKGDSSKEIAEKLYISLETVLTHRKNILSKAGCRNTTELVAQSVKKGYL